MAFLSSRLTESFDFFDKQTKDMLYEPAYAAVLGEGGYSFQNVAAMSNRGFEFTIGWRDSVKDFHYDISFNGSFNKNRITQLPEDVYYTWGCGNGDNISNVGYALGSWLGYQTDGVFRTQAEVDEYTSTYNVQYGAPGVGRLRYVDSSKCHLRTLRFFIQSQNLFTITSYTGADPEGLGYTYPIPRTFTFGLSIGL